MKQLLMASGVIATIMLTLPASAYAGRYERDHHHGDHHACSHKKSHKKHSYSRPARRDRFDTRYHVSFGSPYYGSYYRSHHRHHGWPVGINLNLYEPDRHSDVIVVETETRTVGAQASAGMFVYPQNGQSMEQRDRDRYECHLWAADQTGYDPSVPGAGNLMAPDYHRAMAACLEGRGYTVK